MQWKCQSLTGRGPFEVTSSGIPLRRQIRVSVSEILIVWGSGYKPTMSSMDANPTSPSRLSRQTAFSPARPSLSSSNSSGLGVGVSAKFGVDAAAKSPSFSASATPLRASGIDVAGLLQKAAACASASSALSGKTSGASASSAKLSVTTNASAGAAAAPSTPRQGPLPGLDEPSPVSSPGTPSAAPTSPRGFAQSALRYERRDVSDGGLVQSPRGARDVVAPPAVPMPETVVAGNRLGASAAPEQAKTFEILNAAICTYNADRRLPRERGEHPKVEKALVRRGIGRGDRVADGVFCFLLPPAPASYRCTSAGCFACLRACTYHCDQQQDIVGESNPDHLVYVDLKGKGHPLNPGVRFGYFATKGYFMKNIGSVKDYRSARQLLLDAESAMLKTISLEKWRMKQIVDRSTREMEAALNTAAERGLMVEEVLRERQVRHREGTLAPHLDAVAMLIH